MTAIIDEFSERADLSKQRRYQLRNIRDGQCAGCGKRPATEYCKQCRRKRNAQAREYQRAKARAAALD